MGYVRVSPAELEGLTTHLSANSSEAGMPHILTPSSRAHLLSLKSDKGTEVFPR